MTNNAYLKYIRTYAALGRRLGRDFSDIINALVQARHDEIARTFQPGDERDDAVEKCVKAAEREFGQVQRGYRADFIPF